MCNLYSPSHCFGFPFSPSVSLVPPLSAHLAISLSPSLAIFLSQALIMRIIFLIRGFLGNWIGRIEACHCNGRTHLMALRNRGQKGRTLSQWKGHQIGRGWENEIYEIKGLSGPIKRHQGTELISLFGGCFQKGMCGFDKRKCYNLFTYRCPVKTC